MAHLATNDDFPLRAEDRYLRALSELQASAEAARTAYCRGLANPKHMTTALLSMVEASKATRTATVALAEIGGIR